MEYSKSNPEQHFLAFYEVHVPQSGKHIVVEVVAEETREPLQSHDRRIEACPLEMLHRFWHCFLD